MKRCENCGFSNRDENARCVKCNHLLPADTGVSFGNAVNSEETSLPNPVQHTKTGIRVNAPAWDETPAAPVNSVNHCSVCGYLTRPGETTCVRCGAGLQPPPAVMAEKKPETTPPAVSADHTKTVKRVVRETPKGFRLVALSLEDESEQRNIPLEGENIILNREMLDSGNNSISRSGHASLTFRDGEWWLDNLSALQSTFIRVNEPHPIREGDVILIGDRLFKFKAE